MNRPYTIRAVYKHPKGRPHCFVFDNQFEFAKFLLSQNQSVQKTPMSMMSAPQPYHATHSSLQHWRQPQCICKDTNNNRNLNRFTQNYTLFNRKLRAFMAAIVLKRTDSLILPVPSIILLLLQIYPTTKENLNPSALAISIKVLSCISVCPCSNDEIYSRFLPMRSPNCC